MSQFSFGLHGDNQLVQENARLRQQLRNSRLQAEIAKHQASTGLGAGLQENTAYSPPYDLINPFQQLFDGQSLLFPLFPSRWDSRLYNSGIWVSEATLDLLRLYARFLYDTNLTAQGAIRGQQNYVIKTGFDYQIVQHKHAVRKNEALIRLVQKFVDEFLTYNNFWSYERDGFVRTKRDGEAFLRLFPQGTGITAVRTLEPEMVRAPNVEPEWLMGVKVDGDDKEHPLAVFACYDGIVANGTAVPMIQPDNSGRVLHIKINVDKAIRRGLSDLFAPQEMLQQAAKLLRSGVMGEVVRQAIAFVRQHELADETALRNMQSRETDYSIPVPTTGTTVRLQPVHLDVPGSVLDINEGQEMISGPTGSADNAIAILQGVYQQFAAFRQVPQWMISGDTGNTNFAASLTAESPAVKGWEVEQKFYGSSYRQLLMTVISIGEEQGLLPEGVLEKVDLNVAYPMVAVRDTEKETKRRKILNQCGLLSRRTWAAQEELDYEHEQDNLKDEPPPVQDKPTPGATGPGGDKDEESSTPGARYKRETGQ